MQHRLKIKLNNNNKNNNKITKAHKNSVSLINQWRVCKYYVL